MEVVVHRGSKNYGTETGDAWVGELPRAVGGGTGM